MAAGLKLCVPLSPRPGQEGMAAWGGRAGAGRPAQHQVPRQSSLGEVALAAVATVNHPYCNKLIIEMINKTDRPLIQQKHF